VRGGVFTAILKTFPPSGPVAELVQQGRIQQLWLVVITRGQDGRRWIAVRCVLENISDLVRRRSSLRALGVMSKK
jgi:hypothetical protein